MKKCSSKKIKIWHVATHTTNIGDGALVSGIQRTLSEDLDRKLEFHNDCLMHYENFWGDKTYDEALVDKINASADLLLIGGGGMLDGSRTYRNAGMAFNLPLDLFKKITIPIVFYAVGYNLFDKQVYWNLSKLKNTVKYAIDTPSILFSVRNDGSIDRLEAAFGGDSKGVLEVPDPGMYVPAIEVDHPEFDSEKINILIQLAGDNPASRYTSGYFRYLPGIIKRRIIDGKQRAIFSHIETALYAVSQKVSVNYIFCPHLPRDFSVTGSFIDGLEKGFCRFNFNSTNVQRGTKAAASFFDAYKKADLVIGMRGHSVICGVGLNTPTIALSSHLKVSGFMRTLGLSDRILDVVDPDLANKLSKMIFELIDGKKTEMSRLRQISDECRAKTRDFNLKIGVLLNGRL